MFADRARIFIKSGKGGDGHVSFRRELYVPDGGPDGGNGGKGGDIIFEVDKGLNTLGDFRHNSKYIAKSGEEGGKRRCTGRDGEDLVIKVPEGTVIYDDESRKVIADMSNDNLREVILKGGKGGQGRSAGGGEGRLGASGKRRSHRTDHLRRRPDHRAGRIRTAGRRGPLRCAASGQKAAAQVQEGRPRAGGGRRGRLRLPAHRPACPRQRSRPP